MQTMMPVQRMAGAEAVKERPLAGVAFVFLPSSRSNFEAPPPTAPPVVFLPPEPSPPVPARHVAEGNMQVLLLRKSSQRASTLKH